ncbi:MAG: right-handed parallel beta-helix repeat-containing protein [Spirochaetes bacterium]|nr:right-handed parallel beta-helix repeat-containing protein [Spirochaetota bacterium]
MKNIMLLFISALHFLAAAPNPPDITAWDERIKQSQRDAGAKMIAALVSASQSNAASFLIEPGYYRFTATSNGFATLTLSNIGNMRIKADGATFLIEGFKFGFWIKTSSNVVVEGLSVDYDPLPFTQGRIVDIHEEDGWGKCWLDIDVDPGYILPDKIMQDPVTGRKTGTLPVVVFDRDGRNIKMNAWGKPSKIERITDTRFRIFSQPPAYPHPNFKVFMRYSDYGIIKGDRFLMIHRQADCAVFTSSVANIEFTNVTIFASPGLNFVETGHKDWAGGTKYRGCKIIRRPGTDRLISGNCDGFHMHYTKKGPVIENCTAEYIGDDFINVRGAMGMIIEQGSEPNTVYIASRQEFEGDHVLRNGIGIQVIDQDTGAVKSEGTVVSCTKERGSPWVDIATNVKRAVNPLVWENSGKNVFKAVFDKPMNVRRYDYFVYKDNIGEGAVIRGNRFSYNLANGIRMQSRNMLIENNTFEFVRGVGVTVAAYCQWLEGAVAGNVIIRSNSFIDCQRGAHERSIGYSESLGTISIRTGARLGVETLLPGTLYHDILIEGNTIVRPAAAAFFVANASNVTIRGNRIIEPSSLMASHAGANYGLNGNFGVIICENPIEKNIIVEKNLFEKKPSGFPGDVFYGK